MAAKVLRSRAEIRLARTALRRRGLSCVTSWPIRAMRRRGWLNGVSVGHQIKSWDVYSTATFLESRVDRAASVLDIGAYASELLCVLNRLSYTKLSGVDLNPKLAEMPYGDAITYRVANFMHTGFVPESFEAITAVSVIEHGFDGEALLTEVARLLRPGGYFVASFDYWPDKIDTSGIKLFGLDWRIFSRPEVLAFIEDARQHGLVPWGDIALDAAERPISAAGRDYTFAWLALQKRGSSGAGKQGSGPKLQ